MIRSFCSMLCCALLLALHGGCGDSAVTGGGTPEGVGGSGGATTQGGGGMGGAGGAALDCSPYEADSCEAPTTCTVVDDSLGLDGGVACTTGGDAPASAQCGEDEDCVAGAHCDRVTRTCKAFCQGIGDCGGTDCVEAQSTSGAEIPGIKICLSDCNPQTAAGCDSSQGPVSCVYRPDVGALDCQAAGRAQINEACELDADCDVALMCTHSGPNAYCEPWCTEGTGNVCDHPSAPIGICIPHSPAVEIEGTFYGGCFPG